MGKHEKYVKDILKSIAKGKFVCSGNQIKVEYPAISARIDGVIENCCAIEIESRTAKQIRGALLDLTNHKLKKKLLIIIRTPSLSKRNIVEHCENILSNYLNKKNNQVVLLEGTGNNQKPKKDKIKIKNALSKLGCLSPK